MGASFPKQLLICEEERFISVLHNQQKWQKVHQVAERKIWSL